MRAAMQQLLTQMREERNNLPLPVEWDRAYQSIEMMIQHTYIPLEREQMLELISFVRIHNKMGKTAEDLLEQFEAYKGGEQ